MNFGQIVGQSGVTGNLARQMRSGRIVHAYLLAGERGSGKRTLCEICAQTLVCTGDDKPCGVCGPCVRAATANHPDITIVEPGYAQKGSDAIRLNKFNKSDRIPKSIGVDDIRALETFLNRRPFEAGRNIAIIPRANIMTVQAQNALLKTLETPPGDSVLFLCADNVRTMLPTIVSRCRIVNLPPVSADIVERYLIDHGVASDRARLLSAIAGGSIGRALEMDADEEYWAVRDSVLDALQGLAGTQNIADFTYKLKDQKEHSDWVLDTVELYARDLMLYGEADALNVDRRAQLAGQAARISGGRLLEGAVNARRRLASNVGWNQVLDMLCFEALEV